MKTQSAVNKHVVAVGLVIGIAMVACAQQRKMGEGGGKVEIKQGGIVIHPTVKLSDADAKAMDNVLAKYDAALYKIETVEDGKVTKTQGKLEDAVITQAAKAEVAMPQPGMSHKRVQVTCPLPCKDIQRPPTLAAREELLKGLEPILSRYQ